MWGDGDPVQTREVWASRLSDFGGEDIGRALEAMEREYRDFPPTLPQFAQLCRDARGVRMQNTKRLAGPRTPMPDHVRAQLEAFRIGHVTSKR